MRTVLGIDLGGTHLKSALVTSAGELAEPCSERSQVAEGPESVVRRVARIVERYRQLHEFDAVGIAICAPLPSPGDRITRSASLPGWLDVPILSMLRREIAHPISLENDAACAVLAESWVGAARDAHIVAGLTLGTGVGGGLVIDGRIYRGAGGWAAEFGHIALAEGPECPCGGRGCLGRIASARAIEERYRSLGGPQGLTTEQIVSRAERGDTVAATVLAEARDYLTRAIRTLLNILNPDVFVICGGMANWGQPLIDSLRAGIAGTTFPGLDSTPILQSQIGPFAGAIGAARVALDDPARH